MTKKLLLSLGATTALVGTSFAIVSCANTKTEATITYNWKAFEDSKDFFGQEQQSEYVANITKPDNKWLLDAIFTPSQEGAIAKIDAVFSYDDVYLYDSGINVRFILKPAKGFTLNKTTFDINYDRGSIVNITESKITYNRAAFNFSKKDMSIDNYVNKYGSYEISDADKATLNLIFTSDIKGAISYIHVSHSYSHGESDKNVEFYLTANDGFILTSADGFTSDYTDYGIWFVIDYKTGKLEKATITYNQKGAK